MQQKTSFKLDRISADDKFSPKTLNDNAAQVESALNTMSTMMVAGDAQLSTDLSALDARVTALEVHKIAVGYYRNEYPVGTTAPNRDVDVGFHPLAVIITPVNGGTPLLLTTTYDRSGSYIVENKFHLGGETEMNKNHVQYVWLALA